MSRFYTEVALEQAEEGILNLSDFGSSIFVPPLQYLKSHHLPTMPGAYGLPPAGRFATPNDMTGQDFSKGQQDAPVSLISPMTAGAVLLAAFYLFLPQRV